MAAIRLLTGITFCLFLNIGTFGGVTFAQESPAPQDPDLIDKQGSLSDELIEERVDQPPLESVEMGSLFETVPCDQPGCQCPNCNSRQLMLGDWCGNRTAWMERGVTFRGSSTHFGFGVSGGIAPPLPGGINLPFEPGNAFKYTGRGEYDFIFDAEKFGGLPKGKLLVGLQHWYGEYGNISFSTGSFAPAVFASSLPPTPNDPGTPWLTDFLYTQPVSEKLVLFAGKKNIVGTADQDIFAGGDGTDQFVNQALVANPAYLLALPYAAFQIGAVMPREWGSISIYAMDPQDRTRDFFRLKDLFNEGVIVGGQVKRNTNFFRKPGEHHVGAIWKHVDQLDIRFEPSYPTYPPPQTPPAAATLRNGYTIYYGFDQYLQVLPGEKGVGPAKRKRGWGLFGRASISDGNPTPIDYFLSCGLGGDCRTGGDRGDTWGIGWYYVGTSRQFGGVPLAAFGPQDGSGLELYYNYRAKPWLYITPDVQFIKPGGQGLTNGDDAFVYGLRINMKL